MHSSNKLGKGKVMQELPLKEKAAETENWGRKGPPEEISQN